MTIHLSPYAIPGVNILVRLNGFLTHSRGGFLGVLPPGTKITITLEVMGKIKHECYTINPKTAHTPKASSHPGIYTKNLTVVKKESPDGTKTTQVAGWPNNMVCLDIHGCTWNIGVTSQNGRFFLVIEKWCPAIEANDLIPVGMILSVSPLRGTATVHTGNTLFNARLHWSKMPFRPEHGFRFLDQGEVINFEEADLSTLDGSSSYRYEVMRCSMPKSQVLA